MTTRMRLTREELYRLVWSKPVQDVAADLAISGTGLKKICETFAVPTPPRGYWAQIGTRKVSAKPALPPRRPGMSHLAIDTRPHWSNDNAYLEAIIAEPVFAPPQFEDTLKDVEARLRKQFPRRIPIRPLTTPHRALASLLARDAKREGSILSFDRPKFVGPFESRRMRLLNSLFAAVTALGAKVQIVSGVARSISIKVEGEWVSLKVDHPQAKPNRWNQIEVHGGDDDTLRLEIPELKGERIERWVWTDSAERRLEQDLPDIVVMIFLAAEAQYRRKTAARFEHDQRSRDDARKELERRKEEAIRREQERRAEVQRANRKKLLQLASDHRAAEDIRALISAVRMRRREVEGVDAWLRWAEGVADGLDPLSDLGFVTAGAADSQ